MNSVFLSIDSMIIMKTLLTFSDPYVRIDLNTINGDINIDSVLTKTKKKVIISNLQMGNGQLWAFVWSLSYQLLWNS